MASRAKKQLQTFVFQYQGKRYSVAPPYQGKAATLITTDGLILTVQRWGIDVPYSASPETVEPFDPQAQQAADLAAQLGGFVAELQKKPE